MKIEKSGVKGKKVISVGRQNIRTVNKPKFDFYLYEDIWRACVCLCVYALKILSQVCGPSASHRLRTTK